MPKQLPDSQTTADPVRSKLQRLASQAVDPVKPTPDPEPGPAESSVAVAEPKPRKPKPTSGSGGGERSRAPKQAAKSTPKRNAGDGSPIIHKTRFIPLEADGNREIEDLVSRLTGTTITHSHITRALWTLIRVSEDHLRSHRREAPSLKRPPNGFSGEQAEMEHQLAQFLLKAIKDAEL